MDPVKLRSEYSEFIYHGFKCDITGEGLHIQYNFEISHLASFSPQIFVPIASKKDVSYFEDAVFLLGMVEALSYWKATCSPNFIIRAGKLDKTQIEFFTKLLIMGMGEFFYSNKIDFTEVDFVKFVIQSNKNYRNSNELIESGSDLILVGGGKESVVMMELLKKLDTKKTVMYVNPTPAAEAITHASGIKNIIKVTRTLDPKLIRLNNSGYLNGHTPFSAFLSFIGLVVSKIYRQENIIVGNESDAEEANLKYRGHSINHQYSKTWEYEKMFRSLLKHLDQHQNYFSLLRPLSEIQIAKLFSQMRDYHNLFVSCNRKHGLTWCGSCPKCVTSFLLLSPFIRKSKLLEIFKQDLINPKNMSLLRKILGLSGAKPFDCVASIESARNAFILAVENEDFGNTAKQEILQIKNELNNYSSYKANVFFKSQWNKNHHLSENYMQLIKNIHEQF